MNGRTKGVPRSMGPCLRRGMLPVQFIIIIIACCYYYLLLLLRFIIMDLLLPVRASIFPLCVNCNRSITPTYVDLVHEKNSALWVRCWEPYFA